jgi:hypothetical protein
MLTREDNNTVASQVPLTTSPILGCQLLYSREEQVAERNSRTSFRMRTSRRENLFPPKKVAGEYAFDCQLNSRENKPEECYIQDPSRSSRARNRVTQLLPPKSWSHLSDPPPQVAVHHQRPQTRNEQQPLSLSLPPLSPTSSPSLVSKQFV